MRNALQKAEFPAEYVLLSQQARAAGDALAGRVEALVAEVSAWVEMLRQQKAGFEQQLAQLRELDAAQNALFA